MLQRSLCRVGLSLLLALLAATAAAQEVSSIRVMLHPYLAAPGQLPPAALAKLTTLAGMPLSLSGATRTGALEFSLGQPLSAADGASLLRRLRDDRGVLWAEPIDIALAKSAAALSPLQGRKLMVRLVGDPTPDWSAVLSRWSDLVGMPLTVDSQIGNIWVLTLNQVVPEDVLADMAERLQIDSAVQYADPVRHAFPTLVPNDPLFSQQWALNDPVGGVNAPVAWDLQTGIASTTVAVIDTGVTDHPDLAGRFLPGYDFILGIAGASDPGDATSDNQCGPGIPGQPSFFHGTFVSGLIAADTDNGVGIAGLNWAAMILPVRVLGQCGGTFDQITAGVLWAIGAPVTGAPLNINPARVINLSLGGETPCPQALQDAINGALAQGVVVAVSAGNSSLDAGNFAPANCSGVITVGASSRQGDITSYSNFGRRIDVSAPGGDGQDVDLVLSTGNDGKAGPGNPDYEFAAGTSFSAPHVAGTASLMIARNANLTPGRIQDIITGAARNFAFGTACGNSGACGSGLLDAGQALQSTFPGNAVAPPGTVPVIEYYRSDRDHYLMANDPGEIGYIDLALSNTFQRTGELFFAWTDPALAPLNAVPVCRFYAGGLIDSHYYTAEASECQYIIAHLSAVWALENPAAFYVLLPDVTGACPANTLPVYKFFNNRQDANQRHTIDLSVRRAMTNRAWVPQGIGPNNVAFCTPI
jgi:subtilisin family serine protease